MPGLVTNGNVVLVLERIEEMLKLSVATGTKHTTLCCLCYILKSGLTEVAYLMQTWIGAGVRAVEEKAVISDVYHNLFLKQVHIYITFECTAQANPLRSNNFSFTKGCFCVKISQAIRWIKVKVRGGGMNAII